MTVTVTVMVTGMTGITGITGIAITATTGGEITGGTMTGGAITVTNANDKSHLEIIEDFIYL
ncbi:MAG: hypothetical protein NHB15_04370 [Methanosarcina barkeri]|nr:hypothetical protein [Methanosarcina sp. ERenArc_MAG2]